MDGRGEQKNESALQRAQRKKKDRPTMPPRRRGDLDPSLQKGAYWVDAVAVGLLLAVALYFLIFW
jgi:hypothetical protein